MKGSGCFSKHTKAVNEKLDIPEMEGSGVL
jgi:hypothetical protein